MSASSDEDYQSAEEREAERNDTSASQLSKDLEGAHLSEKDDSMREPETRHFYSDPNSSSDVRGATQPDVSRTTESTLEDALPPASRDQPTSDSSNNQKVIELTEEEIMERKEQAGRLKAEGNETFKRGEYTEAAQCYTAAIEQYPSSGYAHEVAICYANRAACHLKLEEHQKVVEDCSKALELKEDYLKAFMRRAQAYEALEKYEDALEDYKKALELDPSLVAARQAMMYLPEKIKEQQEKLKAEMLGKLKELGNAVLKPFGLSTDNFQFQQDPQTGGYSVNFNR